MVDPRTPVLIGAGQLSNRVDKGADPLEPVDLIAEAAAPGRGRHRRRRGGAHRRRHGPRGEPALVALPRPGPARGRAHRRRPEDDHRHEHGRQQPAVPGEPRPAWRSKPETPTSCSSAAPRRGAPGWGRARRGWSSTGPRRARTCRRPPSPTADMPMSAPGEQARGMVMPVQVYPLFEQAYRIKQGRALDEHLVSMSELWAGFSEVAATNPHAWIQEAYTAEQIRTPAARQPDDRLPVHEAPELQQRRRAGCGRDPVLGRAGRGARRAARPLGVPPQRNGCARPLLRDGARRPRLLARDAARWTRGPGPGRRGRRRPHPRRPLLVLPVGGGDRRDGDRPEPRPAADGHRRAVVRRRTVEQLRDALDRHHGRVAA